MVFEMVRRARRRVLANEVVRYGAYSFSAALASLILLLLLGTQILNWGWMGLLPAVIFGAGVYLIWRRMPSAYQTAQRVDRGLHLSDTLSTALFFAATDKHGSADVRRAQWSQAEKVAANIDLRLAIPIRVPRAVYGTALLAVVASSLFALRYGLDRRLDLRPPLARIVQERLGIGTQTEEARARKAQPAKSRNRQPDNGISLDDSPEKGAGELDAASDSALDTVNVPEVDNSKSGSSRAEGAKPGKSAEGDTGQSENEQAEGLSANGGDQQSGEGRQAPGAGKQGQSDGKQSSSSAGESSNLLSKFRDAMANLMSRMRQQPGATSAQQQASGQNGKQANSQSGRNRPNGKQGQQQGNGQQQADGQDGQPGEDSQSAQGAQAASNGPSGEEPATKQPGSGIGRQDGSKDLKLADQLAAMGKISEIIGKRAANLTGEVTVEVQNSNQQLHTPYAQRSAHHSEAGGEINRDEVPVALQAYVQQYFEQVRKQAPGPAGAAPRPGSRVHRQAEPPKTPSF